jgi:catechol 2,3-dioxygenase-like lactoylglutathione lyase family enzyme
MPIKVVEIHHPALRINGDETDLAANLDFYQGLLGLAPDAGRPPLRGIPGFWINVGEVGQIHLIGGEEPSPFAKGPGQDPAAPHVALAVESVVEAKAELERRGTPYWSLSGAIGGKSEQLSS